MTKTITHFQDQIKHISEIGLKVLLPETQTQLKQQEEQYLTRIASQKYIKTPITGLFNAGKTSLLNALIDQKGLLPVNVIPTTAIPCEIYYAEDKTKQCAEIYREGEIIYNGAIEGYGTFPVRPGDYSKIYVCSEFTKECINRDIVLVDMPGSDSGIKEHNDAIVRYVKEG